MVSFLAGCSVERKDVAKVRELEFEVVEEKEIPEELRQIIEEKKEKEFKISYDDGENLYIVVGYGTQNTGGYSVAVKELYLTANAVYIKTNLIGPSAEDQKIEVQTYPYVVVKTEYLEYSVVFE